MIASNAAPDLLSDMENDPSLTHAERGASSQTESFCGHVGSASVMGSRRLSAQRSFPTADRRITD